MTDKLRLGVNIDHVATIRNARGGDHPDPVKAALIAAQSGADGITAHLREDRRHIRDDDLERLVAALTIPLNLEMAATDEMLEIALRRGTMTAAACLAAFLMTGQATAQNRQFSFAYIYYYDC